MISPFAPLYTWLHAVLRGQHALRTAYPYRLDGAENGELVVIELRDPQTRYSILRALHEVGHSRPWALGAPWSPLTDEQAGRAAAEILRAVGEDPSKPAGVVPVRVLGPWTRDARVPAKWTRSQVLPTAVAAHLTVYRTGRRDHGWWICGGDASGPEYGPEGAEGRLAADTADRALGALLIEDLTLPP